MLSMVNLRRNERTGANLKPSDIIGASEEMNRLDRAISSKNTLVRASISEFQPDWTFAGPS